MLNTIPFIVTVSLRGKREERRGEGIFEE